MNLENKSKEELLEIAEALHVLGEKKKYCKLGFLYPEDGRLPRSLYPKHIKFFEAGLLYNERAVIAANRIGKTHMACYEGALHLTGLYPNWWPGRRFKHPIRAWAVGKNHLTTRDILQAYYVGNRYDVGTGMIPKDCIIKINAKSGTQDAVQDMYIKHYTNGVEDGVSELNFKSYDQGVEVFMGTSEHFIHLDEEPTHPNIYTECLTRTMTTNGVIVCTFTPLEGLSDTVLTFLPDGKFPEGGMGAI